MDSVQGCGQVVGRIHGSRGHSLAGRGGPSNQSENQQLSRSSRGWRCPDGLRPVAPPKHGNTFTSPLRVSPGRPRQTKRSLVSLPAVSSGLSAVLRATVLSRTIDSTLLRWTGATFFPSSGSLAQCCRQPCPSTTFLSRAACARASASTGTIRFGALRPFAGSATLPRRQTNMCSLVVHRSPPSRWRLNACSEIILHFRLRCSGPHSIGLAFTLISNSNPDGFGGSATSFGVLSVRLA